MTQELPADGRALPDRQEPSAAIRAAQERLLELRRQHGIPTHGRDTRYEIRDTSSESARTSAPSLPCSPAPLPPSLLAQPVGWHSETLANHLRARRDTRYEIRDTKYEIRNTSSESAGSPAPLLPCPPAPPLHSSLVTRHSSLVRVYPDLALAILRRKKAAPGRVWLLLRGHDAQGRGRVPAREAARLLAGDDSPLRVCGRRQLANLLAAGDGLFWDRAPGRSGEEQLWLRGVARVAAALGVERLGGSPVAVPLAALTGTIGHFRAHLYASFHSGRQRPDRRTGRPRARGPISRSTLCKLSGVTSNSQRNYERRARVSRRPAIAVGPLAGAADEHEVAWRRGRALFHLRDDKGRYGRPGAVYLAWQLPNEYTGPHAPLPRGHQKRLNRALADLFHNGMTGNGELRVTSDELRVTSEEAQRRPAGGGSVGQQASGSVGQWVSRSVGQQASGSVSDNHCPVDSGQWVAESGKCPAVGDPSAVGGRPSAVSESVGQWISGSVGQSSNEQRQRSQTNAPSLVTRRSSLVTDHSSFVIRHYYSSAKSAALARGGHERYWRYGEAWLWQPEIRDTKYEIRVQSEASAGDHQPGPTGSSFLAQRPPAQNEHPIPCAS